MSDFSRLMEAAMAAGAVLGPPSLVDIPMISGTGIVGDQLTATMGNWLNQPTSYAGQWFSDANEVGTGTDYVVQASDVDHMLTCVVTATNGVGSMTAPPSNAIVGTEHGRGSSERSESPAEPGMPAPAGRRR